MTKEKILELAHTYVDKMIERDPSYVRDYPIGSINAMQNHQAVTWFLIQMSKAENIFIDNNEVQYTKETGEASQIFLLALNNYKKEKYLQLYGPHKAEQLLMQAIENLKTIKLDLNTANNNLKYSSAYSKTLFDVPAEQIDNTINYINALILHLREA